jgi:hypothetical protein
MFSPLTTEQMLEIVDLQMKEFAVVWRNMG